MEKQFVKKCKFHTTNEPADDNKQLLSNNYVGKNNFKYFAAYVNPFNYSITHLLRNWRKLHGCIKRFDQWNMCHLRLMKKRKKENILHKYLEIIKGNYRIKDLISKDFDVELIGFFFLGFWVVWSEAFPDKMFQNRSMIDQYLLFYYFVCMF